jgi:hypothetical protein
MWARVARFEGDPATVDAAVERGSGLCRFGQCAARTKGRKDADARRSPVGRAAQRGDVRHRGRDAQRRRSDERRAASQRRQALIGRVLRGSRRDSALAPRQLTAAPGRLRPRRLSQADAPYWCIPATAGRPVSSATRDLAGSVDRARLLSAHTREVAGRAEMRASQQMLSSAGSKTGERLGRLH